MIEDIKLEVQTKKRRIRVPAQIEYAKNRIFFLKSPFALKDEIKSMAGSKWHGYDEDDGRKIWSVEDCPRNRFQLNYLKGEPVYDWFDQPLVRHEYERPLMDHQKDMSDAGLTYHFHIFGAEMGTGKTLSAQEVIEKSKQLHWYWVGPKTSLPNIKREFRKWDFPFAEINVEFMTYDELVRRMDSYKEGDALPAGVIFDESSRLKNKDAQRTKAAQLLADEIRRVYGTEGYVILMSGTPSPKTPADWWAQCEITYPGFLKEGSPKALLNRLGIIEYQLVTGIKVPKLIGWKDDERKCADCGKFEDDHELAIDGADYHEFVPCKNEVAYMYERLQGLVTIKHKKDCLTLPEKRYRTVRCKPTSSALRVAKALAESAPNTITGVTWLRELSDGFQYKEVSDGETRCTHCTTGKVEEWFDPADPDRTYRAVDMLDPELVSRLEKHEVECPNCHGRQLVVKKVRETREVPCPKEKALTELLDENEECGRIVIFAGFTGSVDRCANICRKNGWAVVRCDGRGWEVTDFSGQLITGTEPLDYWADLANYPRVAFVAHPESGGMSLTLTEARMAVFYSNSFKPEYRIQAEDRIHRKGMDENLGCTIVDLLHLPSDDRVINVIRENRKLELMTMGEFTESLTWEETKDDTTPSIAVPA